MVVALIKCCRVPDSRLAERTVVHRPKDGLGWTHQPTYSEWHAGGRREVLAAAAQIIDGPTAELLERLSAATAELIPHRAVAQLASQCASTPVTAHGEPALAKAITGADLAGLLGTVTAGHAWQGVVPIAGSKHPVLAVASDRAPRGSVVVFIRYDETPTDAATRLQALWDLVTAHMYQLTLEREPGALAQNRAVAEARADLAAELGEAHAATLATLLGVLRNQRIDDASARSMAVELALNGLAELRTDTQRDRVCSGEEPAGKAFERLADSLRALLRHGPVELELDAPGNDRLIPGGVAHRARVAVRSVVLAMLTQDRVRRIRVGWRWTGTELPRPSATTAPAGSRTSSTSVNWPNASACTRTTSTWTPSPAGA